MKRLIMFLIRRRFGLKRYETFQFNNQKSKRNVYYFDTHELMKIDYDCTPGDVKIYPSHASLNWLLSDYCKINKADDARCQ